MINSFAVLINVMEWTELKQQNTKTGIYGQKKTDNIDKQTRHNENRMEKETL